MPGGAPGLQNQCGARTSPGWVRFPFASANLNRRGTALRGTAAAVLALAGVALLGYGQRHSRQTVSSETETTQLIPAPPPPPALIEQHRRMGWPPPRPEPPRTVKLKSVDSQTLVESSIVRGITVGALARLNTGELRLVGVLEGAAQCPT